MAPTSSRSGPEKPVQTLEQQGAVEKIRQKYLEKYRGKKKIPAYARKYLDDMAAMSKIPVQQRVVSLKNLTSLDCHSLRKKESRTKKSRVTRLSADKPVANQSGKPIHLPKVTAVQRRAPPAEIPLPEPSPFDPFLPLPQFYSEQELSLLRMPINDPQGSLAAHEWCPPVQQADSSYPSVYWSHCEHQRVHPHSSQPEPTEMKETINSLVDQVAKKAEILNRKLMHMPYLKKGSPHAHVSKYRKYITRGISLVRRARKSIQEMRDLDDTVMELESEKFQVLESIAHHERIRNLKIPSELDHGVENQNEKEFAKSKWKKQVETAEKDLTRENSQLRNRVKQLVERLEKIKSEGKSEKPNPVENQAATYDPYSNLDKVINTTLINAEFASALLESERSGHWDSTTDGFMIVRNVAIQMVSNRTEFPRSTVLEYYREKSLDPKSHFSVISVHYLDILKSLPYRKGIQMRPYPTPQEIILGKIARKSTFIDPNVPLSGKPSAEAVRLSMFTKILNFTLTIATCDSWIDLVKAVTDMLIYTATPDSIDALLRRAGAVSIEKFVDDRLKAVPVNQNISSDGIPDVTEEPESVDPLEPIESPPPKFSMEAFKAATMGVKKKVKEIRERNSVINQDGEKKSNIFREMRGAIRLGIGLESKIPDIPILHLLDEAICLAVFACHPKGVAPESYFYTELLHRATKVHKTDGINLISRACSAFDTAMMICETISDGTDLSVLVNPLNVELRLAKLTGLFSAYQSGNLDLIKLNREDYTMSDFERDALKLSDDIERIIENRIVKPQAMPTFQRFYAKALEMRAKILIIIKARTEKDMPYFVALFGEAGVGKTQCAEVVKRVVSVAYETDIKLSDIWTPSNDPNAWQVGATSASKFLQFMEHNAVKRLDQTSQVLYNMTEIADTTPTLWNKPDLETKGSAFNFLRGGVIACNQKDFGVPRWLSCPSALMRRIDFFEIKVAEQYGKKNKEGTHLVPDSTKIPIVNGVQIPDIHVITQYTMEQKEVPGDLSGNGRKTVIKQIGEEMNDTQWAKLMLENARRIRSESKTYNDILAQARTAKYCYECAMPDFHCRCEGGFKLPPVKHDCSVRDERVPWTPLAPIKAASASVMKIASDNFATYRSSIGDSYRQRFPIPTEPSPGVLAKNQNSGTPDGPFTPPTLGGMDLGLSAFICDHLNSLLKGIFVCALNSIFNIYTTIVFPIALMWYPPLAGVVFFLMLVCTLSVGTMSNHAANLLVRKSVDAGKPVRYWSSNITEIAVVVASLGAAAVYYNAKTNKETKPPKSNKKKKKEPWKMHPPPTDLEFYRAGKVWSETGKEFDRRDKTLKSWASYCLKNDLEWDSEAYGDNPIVPGYIGGVPVKSISSSDDSSIESEDDMPVNNGFQPVGEEEIQEKMRQSDLWKVREPIVIEAPRQLKTMTADQVISVLDNNTIRVTAGNVYFRGLFLTGNCLHVVCHKDEFKVGQEITLQWSDTRGSVKTHVIHFHRNTYKGKDIDTALVVIDTKALVRNILHLFKDVPDMEEVGLERGFILNTPISQRCLGTYRSNCRSEDRSSEGWHVKLQHDTKAGDCGSALVAASNPCLVAGFHVALCPVTGSQCVPFSYDNFERMLKSLPPSVNQCEVLHENCFFDNSNPCTPSICNDEPSKRVCTRFIRDGGPEQTATSPSVTVLGHDASTRLSGRSEITVSPISSSLEEEGWVREHTSPKLENNRTAATVLQYGCRGALSRPPGLQEAIMQDYVKTVSDVFVANKIVPNMLTYDEALHGVSDNKFIKPMALNKACGGGMRGKKRDFASEFWKKDTDYPGMDLPEPPSDFAMFDFPLHQDTFTVDSHTVSSSCTDGAVILEPLTAQLDQRAKDMVEHIFREAEAGRSCHSAVWAALKDDPILLAKVLAMLNIARMVTSPDFPKHVSHTIVYGSIVGHLRLFPFSTGCYEGVSYQSEDWHDIAVHHMSFPGDFVNFLDGDTKKMDLSMNYQDLVTTTEILARIGEKCGSTTEHVALMRKFGYDMAQPIVNLFGEWVHFFMNTSGNKLTITYNNISGVQMRVREAWCVYMSMVDIFGSTSSFEDKFPRVLEEMRYWSSDKYTRYLTHFRLKVKVGSIGDDSLVSTTDPNFTMEFITAYFKTRGVTITGSAKTSETFQKQELRDLSCCQRGFRWHDELGRIVGPLSLRSLSRSLHLRLPSKEDPDVVEKNIVITVLEELVLHGEEVYLEYSSKLFRAIVKSGREGIHGREPPSYADKLAVIVTRFPSSSPPDPELRRKFLGIKSAKEIAEEEFEVYSEAWEEVHNAGGPMEYPIPSDLGIPMEIQDKISTEWYYWFADSSGDEVEPPPLLDHLKRLGWEKPSDSAVVNQASEKPAVIAYNSAQSDRLLVELGQKFVEHHSGEVTEGGTPDPATPHANFRVTTLTQNTKHRSCTTPRFQEVVNQNMLESEASPQSSQMENLEIVTQDSTTETLVVPHSDFPYARSAITHDSMESVTMRPIKLASVSWGIGMEFETHLDPWTKLLTNQQILNKIQFFRFFRGELEVEAFIDGTPFHYGRAWMTYTPLRAYDEITQYSRDNDADLVEMSQRPRVDISPRDSQGGKMVIPFIYNRDYLDLLSNSLNKLGVLSLKSIVPLKMANGGNQSCTITILGRIKSMELSTPTTHSFPVKNQSAEVTTSTQIGHGSPIISAAQGRVNSSPDTMWLARESTSYKDLGTHETLIAQVNWSSDDPSDKVLLSLRCSPHHGMTSGPIGLGQEFHVSVPTWLATPYTYWKGTVKYRFEFVTSPVHKGRLMFAWDPIYTITNGDYNKNYSTMVDLGVKTDHTALIGWGQDLPFLPTITGMSQLVNQSVAEYTTPAAYANGVLTMSVFSPLMIPSEAQETNVTILVYSSMEPDYELAVLRTAIGGTKVLKNSDNEDVRDSVDLQADNPNPVIAPIPVVNPINTVTKVLDICEEPGPLLGVRQLPGPGGLVDLAWPGASNEPDMDRVKMSTGRYKLSSKTPLNTALPMILRLRGFVAGTTTFRIEIPSNRGGFPRVISSSLSGITDVKDIVVDYLDEGVPFLGTFDFVSNNQVHLVKIIYNLPKWRKLTLDTPTLLSPSINFYSLDGKTLLTDQSLTGRSGVSFRVRISDAQLTRKPIGNVVVSYTASGPETGITLLNGSTPFGYLAPTAASELRHLGIEEVEGALVRVPAGSTINVSRLTVLLYDDTATRTAIKALPVNPVTNQSAVVDPPSMYGPALIRGNTSEFFQETHTSIEQALRHHHTSRVFTTTSTGTTGHSVFKIDHFPFVYRIPGNTTNVVESSQIQHLFEYFVRGFVGVKGGMEMQILHEPRGGPRSDPVYGIISRIPSSNTLSSASITALRPYVSSYQGHEWFNTRLNARVKATLPWQNRVRFAYARSTDVANHIEYAYRYDFGLGQSERAQVTYAIGKDFSVGYFLCTPILTL